MVAFTPGRALGTGRRGVKAGLKAEADPQVGKATGYEKKKAKAALSGIGFAGARAVSRAAI